MILRQAWGRRNLSWWNIDGRVEVLLRLCFVGLTVVYTLDWSYHEGVLCLVHCVDELVFEGAAEVQGLSLERLAFSVHCVWCISWRYSCVGGNLVVKLGFVWLRYTCKCCLYCPICLLNWIEIPLTYLQISQISDACFSCPRSCSFGLTNYTFAVLNPVAELWREPTLIPEISFKMLFVHDSIVNDNKATSPFLHLGCQLDSAARTSLILNASIAFVKCLYLTQCFIFFDEFNAAAGREALWMDCFDVVVVRLVLWIVQIYKVACNLDLAIVGSSCDASTISSSLSISFDRTWEEILRACFLVTFGAHALRHQRVIRVKQSIACGILELEIGAIFHLLGWQQLLIVVLHLRSQSRLFRLCIPRSNGTIFSINQSLLVLDKRVRFPFSSIYSHWIHDNRKVWILQLAAERAAPMIFRRQDGVYLSFLGLSVPMLIITGANGSISLAILRLFHEWRVVLWFTRLLSKFIVEMVFSFKRGSGASTVLFNCTSDMPLLFWLTIDVHDFIFSFICNSRV